MICTLKELQDHRRGQVCYLRICCFEIYLYVYCLSQFTTSWTLVLYYTPCYNNCLWRSFCCQKISISTLVYVNFLNCFLADECKCTKHEVCHEGKCKCKKGYKKNKKGHCVPIPRISKLCMVSNCTNPRA